MHINASELIEKFLEIDSKLSLSRITASSNKTRSSESCSKLAAFSMLASYHSHNALKICKDLQIA